MVQRSRRAKRKRQVLDNHQRCWIWGRHAVTETLCAGRWPILQLILSEQLSAAEQQQAVERAKQRGVEVSVEPHEKLRKRCRAGDHQGYLAKMSPFPYEQPDELLHSVSEQALFVILDGVQDPFNFGAILRSAEVFGIDGVIISETGQVGVNSLVARSSAGAVNHLPIVRVADLVTWAKSLKSAGLTLIAGSERADVDLSHADFSQPAALVIGNEGCGIRSELLAVCDAAVRIPQAGRVGSLNAAVSAGILFYEASRQRSAGGDAQ